MVFKMDQIFYNAYTNTMNGIIKPTVDYYNYVMEFKSDPRTDDWFLVRSPGLLLTIVVTYVYFSVKAGPRFMKDRKPIKLKYTLIVYNFIQVLLSIYLFYEALAGGWAHDYKFSCQSVDYSMNPRAIRMANAVWWYYIAKLSELLDTVFFVLRKKNNQITFLHVYHHFMMVICGWIGVKFLPGGHGTFLGLVNTFIHIWMYLYYMIAALGPQYQKHLWWKRHLTEMQMVQFCFIFIHEFQVLFRQCDYPKAISMLLTVESAFFLYLFGKFYIRAYTSILKKPIVENNNIQNDKLKHH